MWKESLQKIEEQGFDFDSLIDSERDDRFGITLLIRPDQKVKESIQEFINEIKQVEPHHHFYPTTDIHVTVMPLISCYEGFRLTQIDPQKYIDLLADCLIAIPGFIIQFCGVTASPSCIMVKGFPSNATLELVRNRLRAAFKKVPLEQSLDKRYPLQTAHSTVIRFKHQVRNPMEILAKIEQFNDCDFGTFKVDQMELVFNDWYQREKKVKQLFSFRIG